MNPSQLFNYARGVADRNEAAGRGTRFPTVRQAAARFRCKQADIVSAVEDADREAIGAEYFGLAVGGMAGSGYFAHSAQGDYEIEAYRPVT